MYTNTKSLNSVKPIGSFVTCQGVVPDSRSAGSPAAHSRPGSTRSLISVKAPTVPYTNTVFILLTFLARIAIIILGPNDFSSFMVAGCLS